MRRRILGISLAVLTLGTTAFAAESRTVPKSSEVTINASAAPQWRRDRSRHRNVDRGTRTVTRTRVVRHGRRLYRETYVVRYFGNGRTDTRVISRVRIS